MRKIIIVKIGFCITFGIKKKIYISPHLFHVKSIGWMEMAMGYHLGIHGSNLSNTSMSSIMYVDHIYVK